MGRKIVILEDNAERVAAMADRLADRFPQFSVLFHDEAPAMIEAIDSEWDHLAPIGLDHDLELKPTDDGRWIDSGAGREVADYLASRTAICPIVIHSTNVPAAVGMEQQLQEHGWQVARVTPFDNLEWINAAWFPAVRRALVGPIRKERKAIP